MKVMSRNARKTRNRTVFMGGLRFFPVSPSPYFMEEKVGGLLVHGATLHPEDKERNGP